MGRPSFLRLRGALFIASLLVTGLFSAPAGAATQARSDGLLTLTLAPPTGVTPTTPITITVNGPGGWHINLCDTAIGTDLGLLGLIDNCLPAGTIAGPSGSFTFSQTIFQTLSGRTVNCAASPTSCMVVVYPGDQTVPFGPFARAPISFVLQPLAASPVTSLTDGQSIEAYVNGSASSTRQVAQCALPTGTTLAASACATPVDVQLDADGRAQFPFTVAATLSTGTGVVDCTLGSCGLASFDTSGALVATIPLEIIPTPHVSLSPTTDLLDGDALTLSATGLLPGETAVPEQCVGPPEARPCITDYEHPLSAGADGTVTTTVLAAQRFSPTSGFFGYCRLDDCSYGLRLSGPAPQPDPVPYTLAAGAVTATPSTGLADAQGVTLDGTGLMPTYAGRSLGPFTSGGWVTVECSASLPTTPNLYETFRDCGFPGGAAVVTVAGSTMTTTVAPHASLTAVLGATTDCTTAPGACVIGLVRFEQDVTMSTHLTPLTFG